MFTIVFHTGKMLHVAINMRISWTDAKAREAYNTGQNVFVPAPQVMVIYLGITGLLFIECKENCKGLSEISLLKFGLYVKRAGQMRVYFYT